ncbi:hypothetical protein DFH08DRAFT_1034038 [Mycena albidolilacea]|uniref:Uncharacterized protein n=1 Tax=Mycena albidolilacea TaxID=1033008 RepID=A0AAD6ZFL7_9AGAR|nr:hypothetical protein DFH08DRAFT_1034038 [Mycena albidolilacea]
MTPRAAPTMAPNLSGFLEVPFVPLFVEAGVVLGPGVEVDDPEDEFPELDVFTPDFGWRLQAADPARARRQVVQLEVIQKTCFSSSTSCITPSTPCPPRQMAALLDSTLSDVTFVPPIALTPTHRTPRPAPAPQLCLAPLHAVAAALSHRLSTADLELALASGVLDPTEFGVQCWISMLGLPGAKRIKAFFDEKYEVPQMRLRTTIYKHKVEVEDEG